MFNMKAALVTPFLCHLPIHPSSYLGYGAAILRRKYELDILDLNAEIYYNYKDSLNDLFSELNGKQVIFDGLELYPVYSKLLKNMEEEYKNITWGEYQSVFITTPSWFPTIPTESILKIANLIQTESSRIKIFYFGNSLGTWTDENILKNNKVNLLHLNNLFDPNPVNKPVDYDSLPTPLYHNREKYIFDILPFRLKHGCIWGKCRFCSLAKGWNSGYQERSATKVIQELEEIINNYKPRMLVCRDNSINGKNLIEICSHLEDFKIPWSGLTRADLSLQEIKSLSRAGCGSIYFGLESGSDRVLNEINKGIDSKQISAFIKSLYEHNIMPAPSLVIGTPGETEDDFEKTIQFIKDHNNYFDIINLYPLTITPASDFSLMKKEPHNNTLLRLIKMIRVCEDLGIKVCVGEQCAEYVLFKKVYPGEINY